LKHYWPFCCVERTDEFDGIRCIRRQRLANRRKSTRRVCTILALSIVASGASLTVTSAQKVGSTDPMIVAMTPIMEVLGKYNEAFKRKDYEAAITWLRKAAELRDTTNLGGGADFVKTLIGLSEFNVGYLYERGEDVPRDLATAREWYRKSASHGSEAGKAGLAKLQEQPAATARTINLRCEMPLLNGKLEKSFVYIDAASKVVQIDGLAQGIYEYRDGAYGKVIKSGYMAGEAINVHQFVSVNDNEVRFGSRDNKTTSEHSINFHSLLLTISGLYRTVSQCTQLPSRR
jgi:hypothetical protein